MLSRTDLSLVLMVAIWGTNFSVLKFAFREVPQQPFNAVRVALAAVIFVVAMAVVQRRARRGATHSRLLFTHAPLDRHDLWALIAIGLVGHFLYQLLFVGGVARTSVANASLILGATPVCVALASAALGRDRVRPMHWFGAAVSAAGIWTVVGSGADFGGEHLRGDLMVLGSVACWTVYTVGAGPLLTRHSPLYLTGVSMAIGATPYLLVTLPEVLQVDWTAVSAATWVALVFSALFALCLSYVIWYGAVMKIGMAHTSIYSNLVPIAAMVVATLWLAEPLTGRKLIGAALVLGGVALTRLRFQIATPAPE